MRIITGKFLQQHDLAHYGVRITATKESLTEADVKKLLHGVPWIRSDGFGGATLTRGFGTGTLVGSGAEALKLPELSAADATIEYRCPKCTDTDPPVTAAVLAACAVGSPPEVAVECPNNHWAAYPCR